MKSILFYEEWKGKKFSVADDYSEYFPLWNEISSTFATIPGTEIWNVENITSTIRQIEFYHTTGVFKSEEDVACLFNKIMELLDHIELQAEYGVKLMRNQQPSHFLPANYDMYINELIMGDNMQIIQMGDKHIAYLNHTVLNYMTTTNIRFNSYLKRNMDIITQKSIPISGANEKERLIFFNELRARVNNSRDRILYNHINQSR